MLHVCTGCQGLRGRGQLLRLVGNRVKWRLVPSSLDLDPGHRDSWVHGPLPLSRRRPQGCSHHGWVPWLWYPHPLSRPSHHQEVRDAHQVCNIPHLSPTFSSFVINTFIMQIALVAEGKTLPKVVGNPSIVACDYVLCNWYITECWYPWKYKNWKFIENLQFWVFVINFHSEELCLTNSCTRLLYTSYLVGCVYD